MNVGTAKIVTNEGDGKYTITQQYLDTTDDTFKDGTVGLVAADAWDMNLDDTRVADDKIVFQMQASYDGKRTPIILGAATAAAGLPFPARLKAEASGGIGEYDEWEEVETDDANPNTWQTKSGGRTHTSTSESLWEANQKENIHSHATTGTIVWVHEETGDEDRYVFDYPVPGGTTAGDLLIWDGTDWIILAHPGAGFFIFEVQNGGLPFWNELS